MMLTANSGPSVTGTVLSWYYQRNAMWNYDSQYDTLTWSLSAQKQVDKTLSIIQNPKKPNTFRKHLQLA